VLCVTGSWNEKESEREREKDCAIRCHHSENMLVRVCVKDRARARENEREREGDRQKERERWKIYQISLTIYADTMVSSSVIPVRSSHVKRDDSFDICRSVLTYIGHF